MPLVHHELCFGCGQSNLFGLLLELERTAPDVVMGRCFIKQDHQGPQRGRAHQGIVGAALTEAMSLACGADAFAQAFTVGFIGSAPVGAFLEIEAKIEERTADAVTVIASAVADRQLVAKARGTYGGADR